MRRVGGERPFRLPPLRARRWHRRRPWMVSPTPRTNAGFSAAACFQTCSQTPGCASPVRSPRRTKWNAEGAGFCASTANTAAMKEDDGQNRRMVVFSQKAKYWPMSQVWTFSGSHNKGYNRPKPNSIGAAQQRRADKPEYRTASQTRLTIRSASAITAVSLLSATNQYETAVGVAHTATEMQQQTLSLLA
jgi:hypothetical protein